MPAALFGITNEGLNLAVNLIILFLVVVWIALVVWTFFDARRRLEDPVLVGSATVASLFPFVGTIVYTILRPPEFVEDRRERELEIRAAELRVRQLEEQACMNCGFPIERSYLRCPSCRARVKDPCDACGKPIDPRWSVCPYCETPVRQAAPARSTAPPSRSAGPPAPERAAKRPAAGRPASERPATRRTASSRSARKPQPERQEAKESRPARRRPPSAAASREGEGRPAKPRQQASRAPAKSPRPDPGADEGNGTPSHPEGSEEDARPTPTS